MVEKRLRTKFQKGFTYRGNKVFLIKTFNIQNDGIRLGVWVYNNSTLKMAQIGSFGITIE